MTRGQIKTNIRINLADSGVTFYSEDDLNESIQDAYDDICALTQCILKTQTLSWIGALSYYNFADDYGLTDYLGTTAIFNNSNSRFLMDDTSIRHLDLIRKDWEKWIGTPQWWFVAGPKRVGIAPKYNLNTSTFTLYYWAMAATLINDNDTFLIAEDMQELVEFYATADLIEQASEFTKAKSWLDRYYPLTEIYKERVHTINRSDLLLRVSG